MSVPNPPAPPPQPPMPPPVPPMPPPGFPGQPSQPQTQLPLVSLILGILSMICGGLILGIPAIITGIMGRKRAKASGQGGGMAVAGIVLGIIGTILSIVLAIAVVTGGIALFNTAKDQVKVASELKTASVSADTYGLAYNGDYSELTTADLERFGYTPPADVTVKAVPADNGTGYCIEGYLAGDADSVIHVPPSGGTEITITINGETYNYSDGPC